MHKWRLALILLLAAALLPLSWLRDVIVPNHEQVLHIAPLPVAAPGPVNAARGEVAVEGIWHLTSPHSQFGGYSALLALGGSLRAFSDRGGRLTFPRPEVPQGGQADEPQPHILAEMQLFSPVHRGPPIEGEWLLDIESATRDPATGVHWLGYEGIHAIRRYDAASKETGLVLPPQMQDWPSNGGAEAMVRLADGRFLILPENNHNALLFDRDPVEDSAATEFRFTPPPGYYPTAVDQLPDGRVLVLLRALDWAIPPFSARLVVADPAQIRAGAELAWQPLAMLDDLIPRDNYEGMAIEAQDDGSVIIWIVSDDNFSILQRTLLVRLRWRP